MCAIMPEHFAKTDPYKQVAEMIGSGPYRFKPDERVPGSQIMYERNDKYVPRPEGSADGSAGPKFAHFDLIEWRIMPDAGTVSAALQQGEIDWWQRPLPDLLPLLSRHPRLKAEIINTAGNIATMRFNHLNPPFNNAAIRRAMLGAVDQRDYAAAAFGTDNIQWRDGVGYFPPGTPMASSAGMEALTSKRDLSRVRREVEAAGYKGEKIVVLWPTSDPVLKAYADVSIDTLKKLDLTVDAQAMDWATVMMRRTKTEPAERGGWSLFDTGWNGLDMVTPVGNVFLRGNGRAATVGWPDSPKIEALCDDWLRAPDLPTQKAIAEKLQLQAFEDVPYIPLCQYFLPVIHQANLTGILKGITVFWNVRRT